MTSWLTVVTAPNGIATTLRPNTCPAPRPRTGDRREDGLRGPLLDLVTAVLAMGEHV